MLCKVPPIRIGAACQPCTGREGLAALATLCTKRGPLHAQRKLPREPAEYSFRCVREGLLCAGHVHFMLFVLFILAFSGGIWDLHYALLGLDWVRKGYAITEKRKRVILTLKGSPARIVKDKKYHRVSYIKIYELRQQHT